jgi:hemerythrin superfamily protein
MAKAVTTNGGRTGGHSLGMAVGAAAVGLVAGIAASAGRKAAVQAAEALTGDWADVLKAEHLMVAEIFDQIDATASHDAGRRRRLAAKLKVALDKHAFEEENAIYPALRLADPESGLAQRLVADHGEVKTLLFELDRADPAESDWIRIVRALRSAVEAHVREEEDEIFPLIKRLLSAEDEAALTTALHKNGMKLA